jgi:hypothetical protein
MGQIKSLFINIAESIPTQGVDIHELVNRIRQEKHLTEDEVRSFLGDMIEYGALYIIGSKVHTYTLEP